MTMMKGNDWRASVPAALSSTSTRVGSCSGSAKTRLTPSAHSIMLVCRAIAVKRGMVNSARAPNV